MDHAETCGGSFKEADSLKVVVNFLERFKDERVLYVLTQNSMLFRQVKKKVHRLKYIAVLGPRNESTRWNLVQL